MKNLLLFFTVLLPYCVFSQDDVYQLMAEKTCSCINERNPNYDTVSSADLQKIFSSCLIQSFGVLDAAIIEKYNINLSDDASMEQFGEKIALKMFTVCPSAITALGLGLAAEEEAAGTAETTITAKVVEIKTNQFLTLVVKDEKSKTQTLLVLTDFENASLVTENQLNKNDRVEITYTEMSLFDPVIREFRLFKVISGITRK